jgi:hypothetical protein
VSEAGLRVLTAFASASSGFKPRVTANHTSTASSGTSRKNGINVRNAACTARRSRIDIGCATLTVTPRCCSV